MQLYRVIDTDQPVPAFAILGWAGSLKEAQTVAKERGCREALRIELVHTINDKENLLNALNGVPPKVDAHRTWRVTARGGLVECPNGE